MGRETLLLTWQTVRGFPRGRREPRHICRRHQDRAVGRLTYSRQHQGMVRQVQRHLQGATNLSASKKSKPQGTIETPNKTMALTIAMNRMAANIPEVNSYSYRNEVMREEEAERACEANGKPAPARRTRPFFVRYDKKGVTREDKGYTRDQLKEDASRDSRHCVTLANNLKKAGHTRWDYVDAHHIVAWKHPAAGVSRTMLFDWKIAINDADGGPRSAR